jgi:WhiB family redox-sensing transcriptional regulator
MSAPHTVGRVSRLSARVRRASGAEASPELGATALRLVLRELLYDGGSVPEWQRAAACAEPDVDRAVFFPPEGWAADLAVAAAKRVCARCPVRDACLAAALAWEDPRQRHGVAGGLAPAERTALRRGGGR